MTTSTHEENAALARRFFEEIFNRENPAAADEMVAPSFVEHNTLPMPAEPLRGPAAITWYASVYRTAFPDLRTSVDEVITAGDRVITRTTWSGRQTGQLLGADPTGKQIQVSGIDIFRISDGQLVEHWGSFDVLTMLSQLGFLPSMG